MDHRTNVRVKFLEENIGVNLQDLGVGTDFLGHKKHGPQRKI